MSTRAIQFLKGKKGRFKVVKYRHDQKGAEFAAKAIGFPLNKTIKTLVVDLGGQQHILALVPGDCQLDLKKVARAAGAKKSTMADKATAERLTGYLVGGISPFGTQKRVPVMMETSLVGYERVAINAGQRGAMLLMSPMDIVDLLSCTVAPISRKDQKLSQN